MEPTLSMAELGAALAPVLALVLGLLVGSFLNVVILRLPPRLEYLWQQDARMILDWPQPIYDLRPPGLVFESSHCPRCKHQLRFWENIPLLSWLLLRGRCRACRAPISLQYPLVEALSAVASWLVVLRFGFSFEAGVALLLSWFLIAASGIDLRTTLLPDQLTLPLLWLGLIAAVFELYVTPVAAIWGAVAGYLCLWSVYWVFKWLTGREGMGYGDFKLLAALGAFCGWQGLLPIVLMSSLIGAVVGGAFLLIAGQDRHTQLPFGPYLAVAGWLQFLYGEPIFAFYQRLLGLG